MAFVSLCLKVEDGVKVVSCVLIVDYCDNMRYFCTLIMDFVVVYILYSYALLKQ